MRGETYSLDHNQLLLRGTSLKNTEWIIGIIAYTGHDSKIMKNSTISRSKLSKQEVQTNKQIIFIFIFQILVCSTCAAANLFWTQTWGQKANVYLEFDEQIIKEPIIYALTLFGTWLLLFANCVPISLIVTLEVVRFFQAMFIQWDINIYDTERDLPTMVQSSNLNEELGQVQYIFSDKTGTLTQNVMEFKKLCVGKYTYGIDNPYLPKKELNEVQNFNFQDDIFEDHLRDKSHPNHQNIINILTHLAICHTVMVESKNEKQFYNASSPDELALVNAAKYFGFTFKGRDDDNNIEISVQGITQTFELLNILEFTSLRKRMTVIVRTPENKIKVLSKGADIVIFPRLKENSHNTEVKDQVNQYLESYAKLGLRTLLISEKEVSNDEYEAWLSKYKIAQQEMNKREEKIEEVADLMEQDFDVLGATAIEDKLQDDVDNTISFIKRAGIKLWVLTGDKTETAINIGFSCKLLNEKMELYVIDATQKHECLSQIADSRKMQINSEGLRESATIVTGESLFKIMNSERITWQFLKLACSSQALIACRMSPKQKADIVKLIQKFNPKLTTLAIGDGANDVSMITAAHVGIGITGVEGQQAATASDYAIGQFKYLKSLIFVHGREAYRRNSYIVCFTFYKNVLFVMPQFWFGIFSGFSGQVFYDKWLYQIFNIIFTATPIMIFALYDQQYPRSSFISYTNLYKIGLKNYCFNTWLFWRWIFYAIAQSALVFFISFMTFNRTPEPINGRFGDLWMEGTFAYAAIVILTNMRVLFDSFSHNNLSLWSVFLSIGSFFVVFYLMNLLPGSELFDIYHQINHYPIYAANLIIFAFISFPIDSFLYFIQTSRIEKKEQQEKQKRKEERKRFTKGLDPSKLAPLHKYHGYAFSGEAGHVPQITEKLKLANQKMFATQQLLRAIKK